MQHEPKTRGFTIVELMVTLAVAAILMGFAVPAFNDFVRQRTMTSAANDLVLAVTFARSEAIRRGGLVSVQAYDDENDNEWGLGYCVVVGDEDCEDADEEDVLRRFAPIGDGFTFDATAGRPTTGRLTFNGRGMLTPLPGVAGRIELCSTDESVSRGRRIMLSVIGQPDVQDHEECHA
ncbi:MAG TPA: GspH/FimT family pseudopilin [Pseudomonadales bacterium]